jgi:hypothetical protein
MFDSKDRLAGEIAELVEALRGLVDGRYACLLDAKALHFESPAPGETGLWALRRFLEDRRAQVLAVPGGLAAEGPMDDVFAGWDEDDFLLAVWNGRVALVLACPDAEAVRDRVDRPLRALMDRLFRWDPTYRLDPQGRGLFLGRAKLDLIVVGRAQAD